MVILDVEIVRPGSEVGVRIGNPTPFDSSNISNPAPAPQVHQPNGNTYSPAPQKPSGK